MEDFKNLLSQMFVVVLMLVAAFIVAANLFMLLAYGSQYVAVIKFGPNYILRNYNILFTFITDLSFYVSWMIQNKEIVNMTANNYLAGKLFFIPLFCFAVVGMIIYSIRETLGSWKPFKKKEKIYGDARWATEKDIRSAGLRAKSGMLLGVDKHGYYIADGYQHALLFAPTGSGKGVGFAIPNCLFWDDSLFVHDIKLENYDFCSGYREKVMGQKCYVWSPADPDGKTHCYNPIDWVSSKPGKMVDDVQKIASLILPEQDFWVNEARSLFTGVVLYLLVVPEKIKSFGEVVRTMRSDDVAYNLAVVMDTVGKNMHPVAYMNLAAFLQKADKERSGVISTLNSSCGRRQDTTSLGVEE